MTLHEFSGHRKQTRMYVFYSFLFLASLSRIAAGAEWCYQSQVTCEHKCEGPSEWPKIVSACGGNKQSPINIVTKKVKMEGSLPAFKFQGYKETFHSFITNNGHTVKVNLSGAAQINGGSLGSTYKAVEIHFHWGKNGEHGSEHTIDGEQYPMEMHLVHIKSTYSSVEEAVKDPSGVAVFGFLYEEAESSNQKYDPIINALVNIPFPDNRTSLQSLSLDSLIPDQTMLSSYFRYEGSLTTPDCAESVIWTVFEQTIPLSRNQLSTFSTLQFDNETAMVGTFRPVQPLNSREVFYSGCTVVSVNAVLVVGTIFTTIFTLNTIK
ncbi:carbonic anhydrase 4b [Astyanax mexicanus]|uniref:carbonic anhydrase 4b n=1 Tax=Astyanax mexicanus TaxID=7994 RepID=UPI0020CADCC4|nr:carbonic anhydrase 4b [Astyanax mexicanus]